MSKCLCFNKILANLLKILQIYVSSIFGQDVLDIVSDIVDPAASILHLTFILPCAVCSNSSIFGQDVLDIVSDIVDPALCIVQQL